MHVRLVPGVEHDRVARRLEDPVDRDRQLDDAEVRAEVSAGLRHGCHEVLADLASQLLELFGTQRVEVAWSGDGLEQCHPEPPSTRPPGGARHPPILRDASLNAPPLAPTRRRRRMAAGPDDAAGRREAIMPTRPTRLAEVAGFSIDRVAAAAGDDPDVLRLENLDTDLAPPTEALDATTTAVRDPSANSYLPFTGRRDLRGAVAARVREPIGGRVRPRHRCRDHRERRRRPARRAPRGDRCGRRGDHHRSDVRGLREPGAPRRCDAARGADARGRWSVAARPRGARGIRRPGDARHHAPESVVPVGIRAHRRGVARDLRALRRARPLARLLGVHGGHRVRRRRRHPPRLATRACANARSRSAASRWSSA